MHQVVGAEADDTEAEFIRNLCEKKSVSGDNLLALLSPIIVEVSIYPIIFMLIVNKKLERLKIFACKNSLDF